MPNASKTDSPATVSGLVSWSLLAEAAAEDLSLLTPDSDVYELALELIDNLLANT